MLHRQRLKKLAFPTPPAGSPTTGAPGDGDLTPTRSYYRFNVSQTQAAWERGGAPMPRHFDVICEWDLGQNTLDSSELSREVQYNRQYYTWHLQGRRESEHVRALKATWEDFSGSESTALEQLIAWILAMQPRSIHDYKPMVVLLQGSVKTLVKRELKLYSAECMRLRSELKTALSFVDELNSRLNEIDAQSKKQKWQNAMKQTVVVTTLAQAAEIERMKTMRENMDKDNGAEEDRYNRMMEEKLAQQNVLEQHKQELDKLRKQLAKKEDENEELKRRLKAAKDKIRDQENKMSSILGEHGDMIQRSKEAADALESHAKDRESERKRGLVQRFQKATMVSQIDNLQNQQDAVKATINTPFFAWAAFNQTIETEWASVLVNGQAAVTVPWSSTLKLPPTSLLPGNGHSVQVPGGTTIETPLEKSKSKPTHDMVLPAFSKVIFPEEGGIEVATPLGTMMLFQVNVPGGSSVILPTSSHKCSIIVPPGTIVYAPVKEHLASIGVKGDASKGGSLVDEHIQRAPRGKVTTMTVLGGSTLVTAMGVRSLIQVPSNCTYVFPIGQKHNMEVPRGSKVDLQEGGHCSLMTPGGSTVQIPSYNSWKEHTDPEQDIWEQYRGKNDDNECPIKCPGGTEILVPELPPDAINDKFKVTLPNRSSVEGPKDEWGVPMKEGTWTAGKLPQTGPAYPGSKITIPPIPATNAAAVIASRMRQIGIEASAAALGALEPNQAATVMSNEILTPSQVARILTLCRTKPASLVLRKMAAQKAREAFEHMSPDVIAAICSCFSEEDLKDVLEQVYYGEDNNQTVVTATARKIMQAKQLLQSGGSVARVVDAILPIDPVVSSRLLAGTPAQMAAYTLSSMAGQSEGSKVASKCCEQINILAKSIKQISARHIEADVFRARLLEDLSKASTEDSLLSRSMKLMRHLKAAYGVRATLARMPIEESFEDQIHRTCNDMVSEAKGKKKQRMSVKAQTIKKTGQLRVSAPKSHKKRMEEDAAEDEAARKVELLCSVEDVRWDMPGGDEIQGQIEIEAAVKAGLAVEMSPKVLVEAQAEAKDTQETVLKESLIVVPIVLQDGTFWGTLSHINCNTASELLLGGLGRPEQNAVPKAYESLELFAGAVTYAVENIALETRKQFEELQAKKKSIGYEFNVSFESNGDVPSAPLTKVQADKELQAYMYWRRRVIGMINLEFRQEIQAADEIRNYSNPPWPIVMLMSSLLIILDQGIKGFKEILGPSMLTLPKEDADKEKLWRHCKGLIKVDPTDPQSLPNLMTFASKGIESSSALLEEDIADYANRLRPVSKMMMALYDEQFEHASTIVTKLMDWTYIQFKIKDMSISMAKREMDKS